MEQDQFWSLLARKLAKEASLRDLYELEKIVAAQPELQFWLRLVNELWRNREEVAKEPGGEEKFLQILKDAYTTQYRRYYNKYYKRKSRFW